MQNSTTLYYLYMYKRGVCRTVYIAWSATCGGGFFLSAHMRHTVVCQMIRDDNDCRWWARYWNIMLEKVFNDTIERQKKQWAQHVQWWYMYICQNNVVKTCIVIHVGTNFVSMLTFLFSSPLRNACKYFTCGLHMYDLELVTWSIRNAISD